MTLNFVSMTEVDFAAFVRKSVPEYAIDQTRVGNWTQAEAIGRAQSEFQQMLPNGLQTPNQFLYVIVNEQQEKVGMLWYFLDTSRPRLTAFIIDFFILPEGRHKNYEAEALALLENEWRAKGVQRIELQVFTHKQDDIAMYHHAGFKDTSVFLARDL